VTPLMGLLDRRAAARELGVCFAPRPTLAARAAVRRRGARAVRLTKCEGLRIAFTP
jgi:hypothetical protein